MFLVAEYSKLLHSRDIDFHARVTFLLAIAGSPLERSHQSALIATSISAPWLTFQPLSTLSRLCGYPQKCGGFLFSHLRRLFTKSSRK